MDDIAIKVDDVSKDFSYKGRQALSIKKVFTGLLKAKEKNDKDIQHALKNVSLEIKKGEFFGIVGRNGSGKSTLLKVIAGIYQPKKGSVTVNGKLVPFIELGVGFDPELTGKENVYLNGALLGFSREEVSKMYDEIVEFAELEKFMDQNLKNYSSGMQVRLAFSIAIRADADILVLDEVLAVGDEAFQRKCDDYFKSLKKKEKTIVLVTHNMDSVRKYCDRAMLLKSGSIEMIGNPEDISSEYSIENIDTSQISKQGSKSNETIIKNLKVSSVPGKRTSQKDELIINTSYEVTNNEPTIIKISGFDVDRNVPIFASNSHLIKKSKVSVRLKIDIGELNDTNLKIAVSIRNKEFQVVHFLPDKDAPVVSFKRTDYENPKQKTTWSILFSRGKWEER